MRHLFKTLALATAVFVVSAGAAEAFCVYNETDKTIHVRQLRGGSDHDYGAFSKTIKPGHHECCNWKTKDCNPAGDRDAWVGFHVQANTGNWLAKNWVDICTHLIRAGGWLTVSGEYPHLKCKDHYDK